jgi:hypothetical protein
MDIRLITVREDFEKAYRMLNQKEYPLSFYEFVLKHDQFTMDASRKLIGAFEDDLCRGFLSYEVSFCPHLERVLNIKEMHHENIKSYKILMDFIDTIAHEENCRAIKISKKKVERLNLSIFDKFENILKAIVY